MMAVSFMGCRRKSCFDLRQASRKTFPHAMYTFARCIDGIQMIFNERHRL